MKKTLTTTGLLATLLAGAAVAATEPLDAVIDAAHNGEMQLRQLITSGISIDSTNDEGETALMRAADKGELTTVQLLIKNGADVNLHDEDGETALMFAADEGHTAVVQELISAGADLNARNHDGETALMIAEDENHTDAANVLRNAGAK